MTTETTLPTGWYVDVDGNVEPVEPTEVSTDEDGKTYYEAVTTESRFDEEWGEYDPQYLELGRQFFLTQREAVEAAIPRLENYIAKRQEQLARYRASLAG